MFEEQYSLQFDEYFRFRAVAEMIANMGKKRDVYPGCGRQRWHLC